MDNDNLQRPHQPAFVECNGAVFEEYGNRRTWFVLWENGLAAILSVLSAVSRLSSSVCTAVQIVGAVLQICGLTVLVVARPHRKLKALLLAVAMEAFDFIGGLCLLVSATTSTDDDPWGDAASVALQIQLYAGVALLILDGLHTGRIQDALRRFVATVNPSSSFEADKFRQRQPFGVDLQRANIRLKRSSNVASPSLSSNINRSRSKNNKNNNPLGLRPDTTLTVLIEMICSRHTF